MKKIFAFIMTACLLAGALCMVAWAEDAHADGVVMRVSALKKDGSLEFIADYTVHEEGWEAAIDLAEDHKTMRRNDYDRVVVDMYADWNAVNGEFTEHWLNGDGFNWDAILVPADVRVTLNLNEYTINRGLTEYELNGEVMFVDEDADLIINNGTITGGWSYNGAGGIHVDDGANVTLNNVHVVGNMVTNDQGAAIALYNGSTLTMKGGSLSNNVLNYLADHYEDTKGTLYVDNSTAVLNDVVLSGNRQTGENVVRGSVVAMVGVSKVTMNACLVENHGRNDVAGTAAMFYGDEKSELVLTDCIIRNNGEWRSEQYWSSAAFDLDGKLTMTRCTVTGNEYFGMFQVAIKDATYDIEACVITDNKAEMFGYEPYGRGNVFTFTDCQFNNNSSQRGNKATFQSFVCREGLAAKVTFINCDLGDSTFSHKNNFTFENASGVGSLIADGSVPMIFSLAALLVSLIALSLTIVQSKKKHNNAQDMDSDKE